MTEGEFAPPLAAYLSQQFIEALAVKAAEKLHYHTGGNIFAAAEVLGGRIRSGTLGDAERQSGTLIAKSLANWTLYLSPIEIPARDRFAVARALGHLTLHLPQCKQQNTQAVMRAGRYRPGGSAEQKQAEWEANNFALAFLMPADAFKKLFKEAGKATCSLRFGVSGLLVRARAQSLGLGQFL